MDAVETFVPTAEACEVRMKLLGVEFREYGRQLLAPEGWVFGSGLMTFPLYPTDPWYWSHVWRGMDQLKPRPSLGQFRGRPGLPTDFHLAVAEDMWFDTTSGINYLASATGWERVG